MLLYPLDANRLFVAIELGGVMRSLDKGLTWEDRKPGAQMDAHTLRMHTMAPGRLYEAAGGEDAVTRPKIQIGIPPIEPSVVMRQGGYAETLDGGTTWETQDEGLDGHHYLWGLAIDPADPDTIVASCAVGPVQAHQSKFAESYIVRRTAGKPWKVVNKGLPKAKGTIVSVLASNEAEPGIFYAANNQGIFRSTDAGEHWQQIALAWPQRYHKEHVQGMAVCG